MKLNPAHHIIVTVVLFLVTGFTAAAQKQSPVTGSWKLTSGNDIWLLMAEAEAKGYPHQRGGEWKRASC